MRAFLAVSVAPQAAERLRHPVDAAVACLADDDVRVARVDEAPDGWVAFSDTEDTDLLGTPGGAFTVVLSKLLRTRDADLSTADLVALLDGARGGASGLTALLPPFAAAHRERAGGPITAANDWLGFRQLYWWRAEGVAAISTSARALAVLAGAGLDLDGLGTQAMMGWQIADQTIFEGVRACPPATIATLTGGALQLRQYAPDVSQDGPAPDLGDAVAEMADILVRWQTGYLEAHPEAVLQLTGGHDSRILLGATPEKQRTGLRALTLGSDTSPDVVIAARLAERYGIRHEVYRLDEHAPPGPAHAHALSLSAARALECLGSPMALAPLLSVEAGLDQGHRLSGLGGEVARGFYYAGQPVGAQTSATLVDRLARWRLFSNEAVEAAALDRAFHARAQEHTHKTLAGLFPAGDWLRATDQFYLYHRMHRWSAAHGTAAAVRRHFVNPMFDRRFIELALAVAPAEKRDSLLLGRLMSRLDPELARIPLDTGLVPARLGTRSVATRMTVAAATARKAAGKVRQRLTNARKPQLGAAEVAALVVAHWRAEPGACGALRDSPVVDQRWLDGLLQGEHGAAATTVAFLVNLIVVADRPAIPV
jgi:asparagine synthase (glutamine-hydrolysing)